MSPQRPKSRKPKRKRLRRDASDPKQRRKIVEQLHDDLIVKLVEKLSPEAERALTPDQREARRELGAARLRKLVRRLSYCHERKELRVRREKRLPALGAALADYVDAVPSASEFASLLVPGGTETIDTARALLKRVRQEQQELAAGLARATTLLDLFKRRRDELRTSGLSASEAAFEAERATDHMAERAAFDLPHPAQGAAAAYFAYCCIEARLAGADMAKVEALANEGEFGVCVPITGQSYIDNPGAASRRWAATIRAHGLTATGIRRAREADRAKAEKAKAEKAKAEKAKVGGQSGLGTAMDVETPNS